MDHNLLSSLPYSYYLYSKLRAQIRYFATLQLTKQKKELFFETFVHIHPLLLHQYLCKSFSINNQLMVSKFIYFLIHFLYPFVHFYYRPENCQNEENFMQLLKLLQPFLSLLFHCKEDLG